MRKSIIFFMVLSLILFFLNGCSPQKNIKTDDKKVLSPSPLISQPQSEPKVEGPKGKLPPK